MAVLQGLEIVRYQALIWVDNPMENKFIITRTYQWFTSPKLLVLTLIWKDNTILKLATHTEVWLDQIKKLEPWAQITWLTTLLYLFNQVVQYLSEHMALMIHNSSQIINLILKQLEEFKANSPSKTANFWTKREKEVEV